MSDSYYNVVVVGTELSGLITAALLAKKGYRVLVLGNGSQSNEFVHEDFRYVRRPWLFSGFETSQPIKRVFSDLSLSMEMHNRPKPLNPFYQVAMPGRRIDVVGKEAIFNRELAREFPGEADRVQQYYQLVAHQNKMLGQVLDAPVIFPPQGFMEMRNYRKLITDVLEQGIADPLAVFPKGNLFRPFALAPLMFSTLCQTHPYSAIQLIRNQAHLSRGLYRIDGGVDALKKIFIEKVKSNCGDYREKVTVDRLTVRRGKVREVLLRDRREVVGCDVVICNMDVKRFFNLIPEEEQKQRYHLKILELQPTDVLYTANYALRAEAIPEAMADNVFMIAKPNKPLDGDNLVMMNVDPAGPQDDPAYKVLAVTTRIPMRHIRPTLDNVDALDRKLMRYAEQLIPFFHEHAVGRASGWLSVDRRTKKAFVDPTLMVPIFSTPLEDTLDASPVACRTAYKNILVAGDNLFSGLGFEGAFLGGLTAATVTEGMVPKRSLLD
ncbi:MAG: hypothetical protein ACI9OJ_002313 [Myxococcota bacterium]